MIKTSVPLTVFENIPVHNADSTINLRRIERFLELILLYAEFQFSGKALPKAVGSCVAGTETPIPPSFLESEEGSQRICPWESFPSEEMLAWVLNGDPKRNGAEPKQSSFNREGALLKTFIPVSLATAPAAADLDSQLSIASDGLRVELPSLQSISDILDAPVMEVYDCLLSLRKKGYHYFLSGFEKPVLCWKHAGRFRDDENIDSH